jgi:hypothetical protein
METRTPEQRCPKCKTILDSASGVNTDRSPKEGDITLCIKCAVLLVFNKDLIMRLPTNEERMKFASDPSVIHAQIVIRGMPRKQNRRHR